MTLWTPRIPRYTAPPNQRALWLSDTPGNTVTMHIAWHTLELKAPPPRAQPVVCMRANKEKLELELVSTAHQKQVATAAHQHLLQGASPAPGTHH